MAYMGVEVEGGVFVYFLLHDLFLLFGGHLFFFEVERGIGFLHLDDAAAVVLFLVDGVEVFVVTVVTRALHDFEYNLLTKMYEISLMDL